MFNGRTIQCYIPLNVQYDLFTLITIIIKEMGCPSQREKNKEIKLRHDDERKVKAKKKIQ